MCALTSKTLRYLIHLIKPAFSLSLVWVKYLSRKDIGSCSTDTPKYTIHQSFSKYFQIFFYFVFVSLFIFQPCFCYVFLVLLQLLILFFFSPCKQVLVVSLLIFIMLYKAPFVALDLLFSLFCIFFHFSTFF